MKNNHLLRISVAAIAIATASISYAQTAAVPAAPEPTIWRFMGIPQGIQKIRDVTVNRRGNHPKLERKPPVKRIADPANLESPNPAIKAAAEIKQAEDLKAQKIKAIKYLATMGCGCYDTEGKITEALIAAMGDCTPDVRLAAIEAIETAANGKCCTQCGSTSCCSEKVTKRLSEIAYERDDTGCHLEPNAEIRKAAAKALCTCCPNRVTGPIEEDIPSVPEPVPTGPIDGESESAVEGIEGEGTTIELDANGDLQTNTETIDEGEILALFPAADVSSQMIPKPIPTQPVLEKPKSTTPQAKQAKSVPTALLDLQSSAPVAPKSDAKASTGFEVGKVEIVGGMAIVPVTITPVAATESVEEVVETAKEPVASKKSVRAPEKAPVPMTHPVAKPVSVKRAAVAPQRSVAAKPVAAKKVSATVIGVDEKTGRVFLRSGQGMRVGASVTVYHQYLTGERMVGHLLIKSVSGNQAVSMVTDASQLSKIQAGDRALVF